MLLSVAIGREVPKNAPVPLRGEYSDTIRQASEIGFKGLEIHLNNPEEIDINLLNNECLNYNIRVCALATGSAYILEKISLSSNDENKRIKAVEKMKSYIDLASQTGNPLVIIGYIKGLVGEAGGFDIFINNFTKSLNECLSYAEKKDITIVMEAINKNDSDSFNTIEECSEFIRKFNSPKFKLHIDTYHMASEENDIVKAIEESKDLIELVDISDLNRMCPDGKHYNFLETIETLKKIQYNGILNFEYLNIPTGYEAALNGYEYIDSLI